MNFLDPVVILTAVGAIGLLCTGEIGLDKFRERRRRQEREIEIAFEEWLDTSVTSGQWMSDHAFESPDSPSYQWHLRREIAAFEDYLYLKGRKTEQERVHLYNLRAEICASTEAREPPPY